MAKIDLTKFKKPTQTYLKPEVKNETPTVSAKKKSAPEKTGRPPIEKAGELSNQPVTIYLTENQMKKINDKKGMASAAAYLRAVLKETGII